MVQRGFIANFSWDIWILNQDPRAEAGKLEPYTAESRLYLLRANAHGVQQHSLISHEPCLLLGVLSSCSANLMSWWLHLHPLLSVKLPGSLDWIALP